MNEENEQSKMKLITLITKTTMKRNQVTHVVFGLHGPPYFSEIIFCRSSKFLEQFHLEGKFAVSLKR